MAHRITMTGLEGPASVHPVPASPRRPRVAPGEFTLGAVLWAGLGFYAISQGFADDRAPLVILGATAFAVMVIGVVWPIVVLRGITVAVSGPTDATVGRVMHFPITLSGRGANLAVRWLEPTGEWMHTEAPCVGDIPVVASRRGVIERVRVEVRCSGPMNIFVRHRQAVVHLPAPLLIGPRVTDFAVDESLMDVGEGAHPANALQSTDAVRSTRPYVAGDAPRLVHWASTARTGDVVVREFEPLAQVGIALVVDLRDGDDASVESAASRAAGAARNLVARGIPCMLVTCGGDPVCVQQPLDIDRALARARIGEPAPVPQGWTPIVVRP